MEVSLLTVKVRPQGRPGGDGYGDGPQRQAMGDGAASGNSVGREAAAAGDQQVDQGSEKYRVCWQGGQGGEPVAPGMVWPTPGS